MSDYREMPMLELDDIQHFLLTRTPALAARYEFLSFPEPSTGDMAVGHAREGRERKRGRPR